MTESDLVRTRFAPSPSGHLHVGGARTALFCWAFARQQSGKFILRIEDTDQKRSSDAASLGFLEDLKWLGIEWDEGPEFEGCGGGDYGPYFSSQRLEIYRRYANQLIDAGLAYRAFESSEELDAARKVARASKQNYRYDRASLRLNDTTVQRFLDEGKPYVVRMKLPDVEAITFTDEVRGEQKAGIDELDDFVIVKADGWPTYHLAVVVDDEQMQVSHVLRGQEHLSNTFKHVMLQDALNFRRPVYAHASLIFNPDGSKMSKRDKDKALRLSVREQAVTASPTIPGSNTPAVKDEQWTWWLERKDRQLDLDTAESLATALGITLPEVNVDDYRRSGYLPDVLTNYLSLLGWSPGNDMEKFDLEFLKNNFSFDRIIKAPAKFDRTKLLAFNHDAIQAMDADAFSQLFADHVQTYHPEFAAKLSAEQILLLGRANHPRSKTLDDQVASSRFFIMDDDAIEYDTSVKAVRKALMNGEPNGYDFLEQMLPMLREIKSWNTETLETSLNEFAERNAEGKFGKVAQPLRIAVSGGTISPAIFDTLVILGRESTLRRMKRCLEQREVLNDV